MQKEINILLRNGYVSVGACNFNQVASTESLATVLMNLEYYGFALSTEVYRALRTLSSENLNAWWVALEPELKSITGDDRNIGDFVVYKNFPAEVLSKSDAEYWMSQILMYWGFPNEIFTQDVESRKGMNPSERKSIMLKLANDSTLKNIFNSLLSSPARWKTSDEEDIIYLSSLFDVSFSKIPFKENLVLLAVYFIKNGIDANIKSATDVLRLGAGLSDGDISLKTKVRFKSFNRETRKFLLSSLESCSNIEEDVARHKNVWKRFLHQLHAGDYKNTYPKIYKVSDDLYNDNLKTFNSKVEAFILTKDSKALEILSTRPGEFARRIVHLTDIFGDEAVKYFVKVLPQLSVHKLVMLKSYLETSSVRTSRVFPPKGSWSKLQIGAARSMNNNYIDVISKAISEVLAQKVPAIKVLDKKVAHITLPNNGSDEGVYNRGTVFKIPDDVEFIRTASYWEQKASSNIWFDNGWNFFDSKWNSVGECCWNVARFADNAAIFSGDPTNSKEMDGKAAQLIDLYPSKLIKAGVRYAVWNVLCYSKIKFGDAKDVFAALQWGKDPQAGKLFEPSRCQLSFELKGNYYTKYVCVIDLITREMTYIDANLKSNVHSANRNGKTLTQVMPPFMEYINSLPTVHDLFANSVDEKSGEGYIIYTDKDVLFEKEESAYIFKQEGDNKYKPINLNKILAL